jgi:hypothetical protein
MAKQTRSENNCRFADTLKLRSQPGAASCRETNARKCLSRGNVVRSSRFATCAERHSTAGHSPPVSTNAELFTPNFSIAVAFT